MTRRAMLALWAVPLAACNPLIGLDPTVLELDGGRDAAVSRADAAIPAVADADTGDAGDAGDDASMCTPCPGGCVVTSSDSENCGTCSHSCLGAPCAGGQCLPTVIARGNVQDFAMDDASVYWTDEVNGNVMKCPLAGCTQGETVLVPTIDFSGSLYDDAGYLNQPSVVGLLVQDGRFYVGENGRNGPQGRSGEIDSCPTTGCDGGPTVFEQLAPFGEVAGLVGDARTVYWTSTGDQALHSCPEEGCGETVPRMLTSGFIVDTAEPWGLAVTAGQLYFASWSTDPMTFAVTTGVSTCTLPDCTCAGGPCLLAAPGDASTQPTAIAAGPAGAYWSSGPANEVIVSPGGPSLPAAARVLASATVPGSIAVDPTGAVYFTVAQPATISMCPASGCAGGPTVVASGLGGVGQIKVDAQRVYAVVGTQTNHPPLDEDESPNVPRPTPPGGTSIVWIAK